MPRLQLPRRLWLVLTLVAGLIVTAYLAPGYLAPVRGQTVPTPPVPWNAGDIFVGVGNGSYQIYSNAGVFKETINDGIGGLFTTGCAFNPALSKLYTTDFGATKVVVFDDAVPHPVLQVIDTGATSPNGHSEHVVFAADGDFYVGHPDGNHLLHRYNSAGVLQQTYQLTTEDRGSDWSDLANDQKTLFYTSEGRTIFRYDVSGVGTQLANFATLPDLGTAYALRLLPPGDGSGGLLVADTTNIKRLNGAGAVVQTYDVPGEDSWFSLNLDPNGTSFWAGDFGSSNFYRFNIATGAVEVGPINTGTPPSSVFGICAKGELTAALSAGRMTGGGKVGNGRSSAQFGFELHCNPAVGSNNLEVTWGNGQKFHLETLTSASCSDDPRIGPEPPQAGFDTYVGGGTGRYNGVPGATATWTFKDAGEPGKNDSATLVITDAGGHTILSVSGSITGGNIQAHDH